MSNRYKYLSRQWLRLVTKKTKHTEAPPFSFCEIFSCSLRTSCTMFWECLLQLPHLPPFPCSHPFPSNFEITSLYFSSLAIESSLCSYLVLRLGLDLISGQPARVKETSLSSYQIQRVPQPVVDFVSSLPLLCWDLILLALWRSCVLPRLLQVYLCICLGVSGK